MLSLLFLGKNKTIWQELGCNLIYYNKPQNTCEIYKRSSIFGRVNIEVTERY